WPDLVLYDSEGNDRAYAIFRDGIPPSVGFYDETHALFTIDLETGKKGAGPDEIPWLRQPRVVQSDLLLTKDKTEVWRSLPVTERADWPSIESPQLGNATATLARSWREGRLYYQFSITATPTLNSAQERTERQVGITRVLSPPELRVQLYDMETFKLVEI